MTGRPDSAAARPDRRAARPDRRAARPGRPLRALVGFAGLVMLWLGWRMPLIAAQFHAAAALLAVPARLEIAEASAVPLLLSPPLSPPLAALRQTVLRPVAVPALPPMASVAVPAGSSQPAILPTAVIDIPRPGVADPVAPPPIAQPASQPILAANAADLAQAGYARLRAGQSAQAAALLDAALALQPGNRQWQADRAALGRRWQIGGFALLRNGSVANAEAGAAASPVLGGGQIGASIAVLADPYARRPLAMVVRANIAADPAGIRSETAQAAIGIRQAILPGVSISAERLIAAGNAARNDWTLRLAAGGARGRFSGYGEAGVLGGGQVYAGGQASARVLRVGPAVLAAATWASVQTGNPDVWRVDIGPALGVQFKGVRVQADYRYRAGGNAAPGSGPALTVSAGY